MNLVEENRIMEVVPNPSIVKPQDAAWFYMKQPANVLTILCAGGYLAGRILPCVTQATPAWIPNVKAAAIGAFQLYDLGKIFSTAPSLYNVGMVGYKVIMNGGSVNQARIHTHGEFPREDNKMGNGPITWTTYKLAALIFKFVSSGLIVHSWLKADANVPAWLAVAGPALGAAAHLIDIGDNQSKISDLAMDVAENEEYVPALNQIKARKTLKDGVEEDNQLLQDLLPKYWRGEQFISATYLAMKAVAFTLALRELVSGESLLGRVSQFVKTYEEDFWGALCIVNIAATSTHALRAGATMTELKERTINKA